MLRGLISSERLRGRGEAAAPGSHSSVLGRGREAMRPGGRGDIVGREGASEVCCPAGWAERCEALLSSQAGSTKAARSRGQVPPARSSGRAP